MLIIKMITLGFILENHYTTIHNCVISLEPIMDLVSSYYILKSQPEDLKTKEYIQSWAAKYSISKLDTVDESNSVLYIYGNEKLHKTKLDFDFHEKYNVNIVSEDYEEKQNRINGFLQKTDKELNITLEVMPEDPVEYSRKAINHFIYNLDNNLHNFVEVAYYYRKGGKKEIALEKLLKHEGNKDFKYYNELVECSNRDSKYIYEFNNSINCLDSIYYILEFLVEKGQYELAYEQLKIGYQLYSNSRNISTRNIGIKYNEIALVILEKLGRQQEIINVLLELKKKDTRLLEKIKRVYNIDVQNIHHIVFNRKSTILESGITISNKIIITIPNKEIISKIKIVNRLEYYVILLGIEITVQYNGMIKRMNLDELNSVLSLPIELQKLFISHVNIPINKLDLLRQQLIYVDINPSKESIKVYIEKCKLVNDVIYLGLSLGKIDSRLNDLLKSFRYLMIMNSPREYLTNTKVLLEKIGIDISKSYIIKLAKCDTYVEFDDRIVNETLYLELQKAFVVNLREREDRWYNIREEFNGLLDLERIDAVKAEPGWVGCFKSHQRCLRIARQKGMNSCLVIEDDCELFRKDSFIQEWNQIKDWLDTNIDKWDVYLGGCTNLKPEYVHEYLDKEKGILRLEFSTAAHFIYYNKKIIDKIIQYDVNLKKYTPLDLVISEVAKGKIVTKVPYLAKQKTDYSDIENKLVNYDEMFKTAEKIIYDNVKQQLNGAKEKIIISPILMGGLGNRMFQVASAYGICKKLNKELVITTSLYNAHSSNDYFKNIFRKLKREDKVIENIFKEPDNMAMKYIDISNIDEDLRLMGYFQTEKYFRSIRQEILELFEVEPERLEYLNKKFINNTNNYFIHVRRGDFIGNNVHDIDLIDYYKKSIGFITNIDTNAIFNVFSDDLEYCKKIEWLPKDKVVYIDEKDELDSLYLMSLCNKGGIGCNSSFSWWGGYLNKNKEKKVIYPSKWFNNQWELEIGWDGCYLYNHQTKEINIKE